MASSSDRSFVPQDLQNFASSSLTVAQEGQALVTGLKPCATSPSVARLKSRPTDERDSPSR